MQKIIIHQLGPVEHCELEINDFMIFTGPQASGKSTIAKSVFFFKNTRETLAANSLYEAEPHLQMRFVEYPVQ